MTTKETTQMAKTANPKGDDISAKQLQKELEKAPPVQKSLADLIAEQEAENAKIEAEAAAKKEAALKKLQEAVGGEEGVQAEYDSLSQEIEDLKNRRKDLRTKVAALGIKVKKARDDEDAFALTNTPAPKASSSKGSGDHSATIRLLLGADAPLSASDLASKGGDASTLGTDVAGNLVERTGQARGTKYQITPAGRKKYG